MAGSAGRRVTVSPPGGAASERCSVRFTALAAGTLIVPLGLNAMTIVLTARTVLVPLKLGAVAVIVVVPFAMPLAVAEPVALPPRIKIGLATVPRDGSTVLRVTLRPPCGAGSER